MNSPGNNKARATSDQGRKTTFKSQHTGAAGRIIPSDSLARHLVMRLLPAIIVLIVLDLGVTWVMARQASVDEQILRELFWTMVVGQIVLVTVFSWALLSGVRSGLSSVHRLSSELEQRSIDDLQPIDVAGLPTELQPLVMHVNDLLVRLDGSMQAQKRFIGHAAHQIRTPLSALRLESELMLSTGLPDDVRERALRIKAVTDKMIRMGQQLLVLVRADESARPQDSFVRLDLCEWARQSGAEWIPTARAQQVDMQLIAPEQPVWVDADPILLDELLGNLIDNALRYGAESGQICLQISANPPSLIIEDNGAGIVPEDADRVFEAFYRSPNTVGSGSGSGLGLAIVREIARAHGGWWSLSSRPKVDGTRIAVVFPGPRIGARLTRQDT